MADNVEYLDGRHRVIDALEEALTLAKAGDIVSIGFVSIDTDGHQTTSYGLSAVASVGALLGGVSYLGHRVKTEGFESPQ